MSRSEDIEFIRCRLNLPNGDFIIKRKNGFNNPDFQVANFSVDLQFNCCGAGIK